LVFCNVRSKSGEKKEEKKSENGGKNETKNKNKQKNGGKIEKEKKNMAEINMAEKDVPGKPKSKLGLILFGGATVSILCLAWPFLSVGLKGKFSLPYVPAAPSQLTLLSSLVKKYKPPSSGLGEMKKISGSVGKSQFNEMRKGSEKVRAVDLGAGDGRVVMEFARNGYYAEGVEFNFWLVCYAKFRAIFSRDIKKGYRPKFYWGDLWKTNLSQYDVICVFGVKEILGQLEEKLSKEMKKDAIVVACRFSLPNWIPFDQSVDPKGEYGINSVWMYRKQ